MLNVVRFIVVYDEMCVFLSLFLISSIGGGFYIGKLLVVELF